MCEMREVPNRYENGYRLYVSRDGKTAYRINPMGIKKDIRATTDTNENSKHGYNAKRKQRYLLFKCGFGNKRQILVSHAVYLAWVGPIPDGYQIDHINCITTDNSADNLQAVTQAENRRRAKYVRYLRKIIPQHHLIFKREDYLRFFAMPFDEFVAILDKFNRSDPFERMDKELTRHQE